MDYNLLYYLYDKFEKDGRFYIQLIYDDFVAIRSSEKNELYLKLKRDRFNTKILYEELKTMADDIDEIGYDFKDVQEEFTIFHHYLFGLIRKYKIDTINDN